MAKFTTLFLFALTSLAPTTMAAPVLGQEECICQPMEGQTFSNSSLASCNKIAQDIRQWRALAFHSPYLADAFVDAQHGLQVLRNEKPSEQAHNPQHSSCHDRAPRRTVFDQAVRKLFREWKNPSSQKTIVSRRLHSMKPTIARFLGPKRPTWPWERSDREDKSPGRAVDEKSAPDFLETTQRYRILCRSKHSEERGFNITSRPELMLIVALIFVVIIMTILDLFIVAWRGYQWVKQGCPRGSIALTGAETQIFAYPTEKEKFDHAVVPAVADL